MKKEGSTSKKTKILALFLLSTILLSVILVFAANGDASDTKTNTLTTGQTNFDVWMANAGQGVSNVFDGVKLGTVNFTTLLLGILVWMILYSIVDKIKLFDKFKGWGTGAVALVITILAFMGGFPAGVVDAILIQYQAMGATMVTIIPFIIMIYFTTFVIDSLLVARLIWLVYTIYYFGLYMAKIGQGAGGTTFSVANAPYWLAIIIGLIVLITIGLIRAWAHKEEIASGVEKMKHKLHKRVAVDELKQQEFDFMSE